MPYYHIYIMSNDPRAQCFELDKTDLSELKEDVILPYLKGDGFYFDGYDLNVTKIDRVLIMKSDISYKEYERQKKQRSSFPAMKRDILADNGYFEDITGEVLKECKSQLQEITPKSNALTPDKPSKIMDTSQVFIVHGHDNLARLEVANFIKSLGLKDIVLNEQASSGKTIIEKIEEYSDVGFAIVLYTPCDVGASQRQKDQLRSRARQNVVFEHGYLMAKIGRANVCPLVKGDLETPTDISGIVYTPMDEGGAWKSKVAREMRACGYKVDLNEI